MIEETPLPGLLRRVRAGDPEAAAELVRIYEPHIRRVIRLRMRDPRLRRAFDPSDVCQSVLASFFARMAMGQYDLGEPDELIRLLATMTRNKVALHARKLRPAHQATLSLEGAGAEPMATDPEPGRLVAGRDLLAAFHQRLTDEERWLSDQRAEGRQWTEIAADCGERPDALRKRLARALDRVARGLGLDDDFTR
jgi:DNA-directed RNA polymerase specialized sigma24 family protein